jgi:hypothetical protein
MGDPEFRNDEKVLLRTPGVYVKSIPFEGILTNKRVILVDRAKNLLPPKEIPLSTVKEVETGENAIRDQILTLSVMGRAGDVRQMILTFSRQEGGNRVKERDEWARSIQANLGASFENVIRKVIPGADTTPRRAEPAQRISVVSTPSPQVPDQAVPVYREPAGIHPIKKIIDTAASPAVKGFDASTLGQNVFCSRCGNNVSADSAFCNRCGSPVIVPGASPAQTPAAPVATTPAQTNRPIDRDIQSIEPLIERSTVKVPSDPLRKPVQDISLRQSIAWDDEPEPSSPPSPVTAPQPIIPSPATPAPPAETSAKKGFIPQLFSPKASTNAAPAPMPAAAPPVPQKPRRSLNFMPGRNVLLGIGAIIIILIVVGIGAVFVLPMLNSAGPSTPSESTPVATPVPTTSSSTTAVVKPGGTIVVIETPAPEIPPTGVQVHVNYIGGFKGTYGIPDMVTTIPGNSGERVWEVENGTTASTVTASFEKLDGSSHELLVEIYKDGKLLTKGSTTIGHGSVVLSVNPVTGVAATPITSGGGSASATPAKTPTKSATNSTATAAPTKTVTAVKTTAVTATATAAS